MVPERRALREIVRGTHDVLTFADLAAGPLRLVARALDTHLGLLYRLETDGTLTGVSIHGDDGVLPLYLAHREDDPLQEVKASHNPRVAVTTDLVDPVRLRRSRIYRHVYRELEAEQHLVTRLTPLEYPHAGVIAMVMCRSGRQARFGERELAFARALLPSLGAAAARADRVDQLDREHEALRAVLLRDGAYAILDLDGRSLWRSEDAATELGSRALPAPLAAKLAALADLVRARGDEIVPRRACERLLLHPGCEHERELDATLVRDGERWLVLLRSAQPGLGEVVARTARAYQLRPSEARVLDGLARGKSNAEIARELFLSSETVRTHVQRILRRMMARSRLEAVVKMRRFGHGG